jgi:hypothetical protein
MTVAGCWVLAAHAWSSFEIAPHSRNLVAVVAQPVRAGVIALVLLCLALAAAPAQAADKQFRGFFGATFGGSTTFVDLEKAAGRFNPAIGASAVTLGDMFGIEAEIADAPGFFQAGDQHLVLSSRVTTLTGNVVVAAPRRFTEYALRPYLVGGAGVMRVHIDDYFGVLKVARVLPSFDVGAGAIGFITADVGVCWEIRRFQSLGGSNEEQGLTFGHERLSFWRASMGLAIRY